MVTVKLTFIGRSGSNHSAFNLCSATSAGLSNNLLYSHVQACKVCGFSTVKSVPCAGD